MDTHIHTRIEIKGDGNEETTMTKKTCYHFNIEVERSPMEWYVNGTCHAMLMDSNYMSINNFGNLLILLSPSVCLWTVCVCPLTSRQFLDNQSEVNSIIGKQSFPN